jgi:hypothetical protein
MMRTQMIQQRAQPKAYSLSNNYQPHSQLYNSYDDMDYDGAGGMEDELGYDRLIAKLSDTSSSEMKIPELQNFLKNPPLSIFNLVPNPESGEITLTANLKPFTQLYILAIDLNSVAQRQIDLD